MILVRKTHIGLTGKLLTMNKIIALIFVSLLGANAYAAKGTLDPVEPRQAPGFELPDLHGNQQTLDDYRDRYLLVNFWAVWCAPCRAEMPSMQRVYDEYAGENFEMLAIHVGPSAFNAKKFADGLKLSFPILVDEHMALADWKVIGLPTTYLISPEGEIVAQAVGDRAWDSPEMIEALEHYLGKKASSS